MDRLSRYQKIVLSDVQNPRYGRQKKWVWLLFGGFFLAFGVIYVLFFHKGIGTYFGFLGHMFRLSLSDEMNPNFKTIIYIYQHLLIFSVFLGVVAVFLVLAFLAYDLQARNEVIRSLLEEQKKRDDDSPSP